MRECRRNSRRGPIDCPRQGQTRDLRFYSSHELRIILARFMTTWAVSARAQLCARTKTILRSRGRHQQSVMMSKLRDFSRPSLGRMV